MQIKSILVRIIAKRIAASIRAQSLKANYFQERIFKRLMTKAKLTQFGKDHDFARIKTYNDFKKQVPIRDYEGLKSYVELIKNGQAGVLWPGRPLYFSKTSGTTSGIKYIPITRASMPNHFNSARNALFCYVAETDDASFADGKVIFLSGSPEMKEQNGIKIGRLSGIVNHHVPAFFKINQLPSYETNCIEDWEPKLNAIIRETISQDMRLISGIPPWVKMYFEELLKTSGKENIKELFPNLSVLVHGGVNYEPYQDGINQLVGFDIPTIETYPASEGFIAYQDTQHEEGLLLNTNSGIFFEFVPVGDIGSENPIRLSLSEVELNKQYAVILSTTAGLWAYNIGDTVQFTSLNPYRIKVTGRVKHFISAFGEHVISKEVEEAMMQVCNELNIQIKEYTVAPNINPENELPHHEWWIEFEEGFEANPTFTSRLDELMQSQNIYYKDLIEGKILQPLRVISLQSNSFKAYMQSIGKLGGQNKLPRLKNDRSLVEQLKTYITS